MRVAPVGLFYHERDAFGMGADIAALTHGHPSGFLAAGAFAYFIAAIIKGEELETALEKTLQQLEMYDNHEECSTILKNAIALSNQELNDVEAITRLGEGWVAEEAFAISVYCALKYKHDFKQALIAAVNHNGDSDSTGAITGNILGAYLGMEHIPESWIEKIELKDVLIQIADDLLVDYSDEDHIDVKRYPGY